MHRERGCGLALDEGVVCAAERGADVRSRRQRLEHRQLGEQADLGAGVHECGVCAGAADQNVPGPEHTKPNKDEAANTTDRDAAYTLEREPGGAVFRGASLQPQGDADALGGDLEHPQGEQGLHLRLHLDHLHVDAERAAGQDIQVRQRRGKGLSRSLPTASAGTRIRGGQAQGLGRSRTTRVRHVCPLVTDLWGVIRPREQKLERNLRRVSVRQDVVARSSWRL